MTDKEGQADEEKTLSLYYERYTSGPLPTPEAFQAYETVLPGAADRILGLAEFQIRHRASMQKQSMWIAFVAVIGLLIGAVTLAL